MKRPQWLAIALLGGLLWATPGNHIPPSSAFGAQTQTAKTEVRVWVNTASGVYHCPGTRWYGNTKRGEYLGECAVIKAGNRPAYGKACGSVCPSAESAAPSSVQSTNENTATKNTQQTGNPDARVWVNTNSSVYHCPGTRWYGTTKHGEFMTQKKAQDGGNRPAYGKVCE